MKKTRRLLSIVLAVLMLFSMYIITPFSANAAGTIAGNGTNGISIDINASPYTDYASKSYGQYAYSSEGCAWFASARVCQLTGKNTNILSGSSWYNTGYATYGFSRGRSIAARALACYSNHVTVVEAINGNTVTVSEGGMPSYPNNGYCVIRTTTVSELQNRSACGSFLGYVYLGGTIPTVNNPVGVVDIIESKSPGKVHVRGWVFDLDNPQSSLDVHVYIGGGAGTANAEGHADIKANQSRPDVAKAYANHNVGDYHGFDATISTSKSGNQPVYVYGINIGSGGNVCIGNGTVDIPIYNPTCCLDIVKTENAGTVFVRGWAFDKDDLSKSIDVHVYIGGVASDPNAEGHVISANVEGKDVNKAYGCGDYHRFSATIKTNKSGKQDVHLYGINIGSGSNVYIGKGTVDIKPVNNPYGYLDIAKSEEPGKLYVKGWAFDKDDVNATVDVKIYVGGPMDSNSPYYVVKANKKREDVNKTFAGVGNYHGYEDTIKVSKYGNQAIYAYAINIGNTGVDSQLVQSPKTVNILAEQEPVTEKPTESIDISQWDVSGINNMTYTGKALKQSNIIVSNDGKNAKFTTEYKNNVNIGIATVIITGTGDYTGKITTTFKITKANNPIKVTAKKTVTANSKKKTTIKKAITVKKPQGKVTYSTNNKKVTVKNGTMTIAKGLKKGKTYTVKITVTVKGNGNYKSKKIVKYVKIKVK